MAHPLCLALFSSPDWSHRPFSLCSWVPGYLSLWFSPLPPRLLFLSHHYQLHFGLWNLLLYSSICLQTEVLPVCLNKKYCLDLFLRRKGVRIPNEGLMWERRWDLEVVSDLDCWVAGGSHWPLRAVGKKTSKLLWSYTWDFWDTWPLVCSFMLLPAFPFKWVLDRILSREGSANRLRSWIPQLHLFPDLSW